MEEIFKFIEKHWILSIIIILGMLAPGIVFIFLWDTDMFWSEGTAKVLLLSSAIMCTIYVYNFVLLYIGFLLRSIEKSILNLGLERLVFPIVCACIELATVIAVKFFLSDYVVMTKEKGVSIIFFMSSVLLMGHILVQLRNLKTKKKEIGELLGLGRPLTDEELTKIIQGFSNKVSKR